MTRLVLSGGRLATMRRKAAATFGLVDDGAIAIDDGWIVWVGHADELPDDFRRWPLRRLEGRLVTPALVDCHTHLVFAGDGAPEFELRLAGAPSTPIAREAAAIGATVAATRAADHAALLQASLKRADALIAEGVGTVEIKSGWGLDTRTERRLLEVARHLPEHRAVRVRTTFLGAHAVPPEHADAPDGYVDLLCREMLPQLAEEGLVDAVDALLDPTALDARQIARVFATAQALGLPVKLHADRFGDGGGGALAARFAALSADHLEHLSAKGIQAMAAAGTVAVLLPGAYYTARQTQPPPVAALREAGVAMAVATDCNPCSSPLTSPLLAMNMACTFFGLTAEESLAGMTRAAAKALGLAGEVGTLKGGKRADLALWDAERPAELMCRMGLNPLHARLVAGRE